MIKYDNLLLTGKYFDSKAAKKYEKVFLLTMKCCYLNSHKLEKCNSSNQKTGSKKTISRAKC